VRLLAAERAPHRGRGDVVIVALDRNGRDDDRDALPMSRDEARQCVEQINRHLDEARALLLDLYEREGWRALGYASWRACVMSEFQQSQAHLYRQLHAARIERDISPIGETLPPLREYHLRQIAQLPPEERQEVALAIVRDGPTSVLRAHKRQVDATLKTRIPPAERRYTPPPVVVQPGDPDEIVQVDAAALPPAWTGVADLVMTSPPYGLDVPYANDVPDPSDYAVYGDLRRRWAHALYRTTNPDHGRACVNVPIDTTGRTPRRGQRHEITPRPIYVDWLNDLLAAGFLYRTTILWWDNGGGLGTGRGTPDPSAIHTYAPAEAIIVVYRGQRWKRIEDDPRDHDLGHDDWLELAGPRACWTFPGDSDPRHPAPFPRELVLRCLRLYTYRGDLVVDSFCGRGTTPAVAVDLGRRIRAGDLSSDYVGLTKERVATARAQPR
jgi:site-specific DNA-methyltransferase (adenine-specific)